MTHAQLQRLGPGAPSCPDCNRCPCSDCHPAGACERVARGRRFFLLGALALPVAQKIVALAPKIVPAAPEQVLKFNTPVNYNWETVFREGTVRNLSAWFVAR